jgi:hypothetical protein
LASRFAIAARQYAEAAAALATSGTSGIDYIRLRHETTEAQARSEAAFQIFTEHVAMHDCDENMLDGQEQLCAQATRSVNPAVIRSQHPAVRGNAVG